MNLVEADKMTLRIFEPKKEEDRYIIRMNQELQALVDGENISEIR